MLAEEHATVGTLEVGTVVYAFGRRGVRVVGAHDLDLNVIRVEAVGDRIGAQCHHHEPDGGDLLAAGHRQHGPTHSAHDRHHGPDNGLRPCPYHLRLHAYGKPFRIADDACRLGWRVFIPKLQFAGRRDASAGSTSCACHYALSWLTDLSVVAINREGFSP